MNKTLKFVTKKTKPICKRRWVLWIAPKEITHGSPKHPTYSLPVLPVHPLHFKSLPRGSARPQLSRSISLSFTRCSASQQQRWPEAGICVVGVCSGLMFVSGWSETSGRSRRSACCRSCSHSFHPGQRGWREREYWDQTLKKSRWNSRNDLQCKFVGGPWRPELFVDPWRPFI